jgi:chitin disaccharide deacetylase
VSAARSRLVVNADDFGLSPAINRGIIAAHRNGIVTSASLMVNGPAFEDAVSLAQDNPALDIGLHLTLTELGPVASPDKVPSLVGESLRFAPHAFDFARRYVRGLVAAADVRTELDAQIRLARARVISHIDSHQHVHALPGIARVIAELASAHAIRVVRYPLERLQAYMLRSAGNVRRLAEQVALNAVCKRSALQRLPHAERFVGFYFGGKLTESNLEILLRNLPASGTIELMCHPAEIESDGPHRQWGYVGSAEREALTSTRIRALIHARGIDLIGQRDI